MNEEYILRLTEKEMEWLKRKFYGHGMHHADVIGAGILDKLCNPECYKSEW